MALTPGQRVPGNKAAEITPKLTSPPNRQLLNAGYICVHVCDAVFLNERK